MTCVNVEIQIQLLQHTPVEGPVVAQIAVLSQEKVEGGNITRISFLQLT